MIAIPINYVTQSITKFQTEITKLVSDRETKLDGLINRVCRPFKGAELQYLRELRRHLSEIITAEPLQLSGYIPFFDEIIPSDILTSKKKRKFRDKILEILDYTDLRSNFYPKYFKDIGIKACVYCNSQLTVSVNGVSHHYTKEKRKYKPKVVIKAKFQVDHFLPKSDYPFLSISLFNLYPVCGSCNNCKSDIPVSFELYSNVPLRTAQSSYKFGLTHGSVANYLLKKNIDEIEIIFNDPEKPSKLLQAKGSLQDTFDIEGIYETQKDVVEELIIKAQIYNSSYKDTLIKSFPDLFTSASLANRVIIGNYCEPQEIHMRPMAKFVQDIAREIGLI